MTRRQRRRRRPAPRVRLSVLLALPALLVAVAATAGCSDGAAVEAPPPAPAEAQQTYVAVGASETIGTGADRPLIEAWPHVLHRTALPTGTVFVSAGESGATVEDALEHQLPLALELRPTLVTVWLNVNDLLAGVPAATYESRLRELVEALRQGGRSRVLVANVPPVEHLPAYEEVGIDVVPPDEVVALVDAYNGAVDRVARATGAEVVDLHGAGEAAVEAGTFDDLVADDGFHPSTEGHARVAAAFADAL